jgi:hypothetical protein
MRVLKYSEIKPEREKQFAKQGNKCPILNKMITKDDAVFDHDHADGYYRGVLHRHCNSIEGRILGIYRRSGLAKEISLVSLLKNLSTYLESQENRKREIDLVHPMHFKKRKSRKRSKNCKQKKKLNAKKV